MEEEAMPPKHKRQLPAWLVGMVIAAVVFVVVLLVFRALGFGDNPVVDGYLDVLIF